MIKCTVVNKHTSTGDVYIGRGSKWGNPFRIGVDGNRDEVCDKYIAYIWTEGSDLLQQLPELYDKKLICFCKPQRCHGDYLAQLANELQEFGWITAPNGKKYKLNKKD